MTYKEVLQQCVTCTKPPHPYYTQLLAEGYAVDELDNGIFHAFSCDNFREIYKAIVKEKHKQAKC
jgi:hypothetical protein